MVWQQIDYQDIWLCNSVRHLCFVQWYRLMTSWGEGIFVGWLLEQKLFLNVSYIGRNCPFFVYCLWELMRSCVCYEHILLYVNVISIWVQPLMAALTSCHPIFKAASLFLKTCLQLKTLYDHMLVRDDFLFVYIV